MEYVLTFNQPLDVYDYNTNPETAPIGMKPWQLYMQAMMAAGIMRAGQRLDVHTATRVSVRDGKRQVQDGPFADTKELLGGFVMIDVPSLDEALRWAERAPCSLVGCTEVFTLMPTDTK